MMTDLEVSLLWLEHELRNASHPMAHWPVEGWAIFGSTAVILRGILDRVPDDIDVFVTKTLWGALLPRPGWFVETPKAGDPPILTFKTPNPLHLFYDWSDPTVDIDVAGLIHEAEIVEYEGGSYRTALPEEVLRHKCAAYAKGTPAVSKHGPDIEAIITWLAQQGRPTPYI